MVAQDVVARGASAVGGLLERSSQLLALAEHIAAIRRTKCGRVVFVGGEAGVGKTALIRGPRQKTRSNVARLTARQLEILTLLTQGLRNAEIAERLVLSQRTVDHHISAILEKLGARSRTEASQHAARLGIVAVPKNGHASSLS